MADYRLLDSKSAGLSGISESRGRFLGADRTGHNSLTLYKAGSFRFCYSVGNICRKSCRGRFLSAFERYDRLAVGKCNVTISSVDRGVIQLNGKGEILIRVCRFIGYDFLADFQIALLSGICEGRCRQCFADGTGLFCLIRCEAVNRCLCHSVSDFSGDTFRFRAGAALEIDRRSAILKGHVAVLAINRSIAKYYGKLKYLARVRLSVGNQDLADFQIAGLSGVCNGRDRRLCIADDTGLAFVGRRELAVRFFLYGVTNILGQAFRCTGITICQFKLSNAVFKGHAAIGPGDTCVTQCDLEFELLAVVRFQNTCHRLGHGQTAFYLGVGENRLRSFVLGDLACRAGRAGYKVVGIGIRFHDRIANSSGKSFCRYRLVVMQRELCDTIRKFHLSKSAVDRSIIQGHSEVEIFGLVRRRAAGDRLLNAEAAGLSGVGERSFRSRFITDRTGLFCLVRCEAGNCCFRYRVGDTHRQAFDLLALTALQLDGRLAAGEGNAAVSSADRCIVQDDRKCEVLISVCCLFGYDCLADLQIAGPLIVDQFNGIIERHSGRGAAAACNHFIISDLLSGLIFAVHLEYMVGLSYDQLVKFDFACAVVADGDRLALADLILTVRVFKETYCKSLACGSRISHSVQLGCLSDFQAAGLIGIGKCIGICICDRRAQGTVRVFRNCNGRGDRCGAVGPACAGFICLSDGIGIFSGFIISNLAKGIGSAFNPACACNTCFCVSGHGNGLLTRFDHFAGCQRELECLLRNICTRFRADGLLGIQFDFGLLISVGEGHFRAILGQGNRRTGTGHFSAVAAYLILGSIGLLTAHALLYGIGTELEILKDHDTIFHLGIREGLGRIPLGSAHSKADLVLVIIRQLVCVACKGLGNGQVAGHIGVDEFRRRGIFSTDDTGNDLVAVIIRFRRSQFTAFRQIAGLGRSVEISSRNFLDIGFLAGLQLNGRCAIREGNLHTIVSSRNISTFCFGHTRDRKRSGNRIIDNVSIAIYDRFTCFLINLWLLQSYCKGKYVILCTRRSILRSLFNLQTALQNLVYKNNILRFDWV